MNRVNLRLGKNGRDRKFVVSLFRGKDVANVAYVDDEKSVAFCELPKYVVRQNYSLIQFKGRRRRQENFHRAGCVALDIDSGLSLQRAIARLRKSKLRSFIGLTRNHQKEKRKGSGKTLKACDRYRIIVRLEEDIKNESTHRATIESLRKIFPESDPATKDGARFFFPSTGIVFEQFDGVPFRLCKTQEKGERPRKSLEKGKPRSTRNVLPGVDPRKARLRAFTFLRTRSPAIEGSNGDAYTLSTANRLYDLGVSTPEECCEILEESGWNSKCNPPWAHHELLLKCSNAAKYRHDAIGKNAPEAMFNGDDGEPEKPTIVIGKNRLHQLVIEAEKSLVDAGLGLYARGSNLVEPVIETVDASNGRKTTITRLKDATPALVRLRLSESANWLKWDKRSKESLPSDPPKDVAESILLLDGRWRFPRLAGIITCPTLRPDGSVLLDAGYDEKTGLLLVNVPKMPNLSRKPTKDDAIRALRILSDLLVEFPYVDDASRSVALSMLITSVIRGALPAAPLHAVRATSPGSGKSYSTDLPSCIISGQLCPVIAAGKNEEETEKRLGAVIRTGQPIVNIDNVNGELGGDALCQLIERPIVQIRLLGRSEIVSVENKVTIFATGNGIALTGDMTRRSLLCSLDANEERPELRKFKTDPVEKVLSDRGKYIAASLTIVRAYIEAGCPNELSPLASFSQWSRLVRSSLVWLGQSDPMDTIATVRAEDPVTAQFEQIICLWKELIGFGRPFTTGEMLKNLAQGDFSDATFQEMMTALKAVAPDRAGRDVDAANLGRWLSKYNGRIAMGAKLIGERNGHTGTKKWKLVSAGDCRASKEISKKSIKSGK